MFLHFNLRVFFTSRPENFDNISAYSNHFVVVRDFLITAFNLLFFRLITTEALTYVVSQSCPDVRENVIFTTENRHQRAL